MLDTLVLSETKVIACVLFRTKQTVNGKEYYKKSFVFDRNAKTYRVLSVDDIGPMAISWDGKRMIRFDSSTKSINDFQLKEQPAGNER